MRSYIILLSFIGISCNAKEQQDSITNNKQDSVPYNKEAIALNEKSIQLLIHGKGKFEDKLILANKLLDSAIVIDKSYRLAYINKITNLISLKEYQHALALSDTVLKIKSDMPELITSKGLIYDKLNDTLQARANYELANSIFRARYSANRNVFDLTNLSFTQYLLFDKARALELIKKEEKHFINSPKDIKVIEKYKFFLGKASKDQLL